MPQIERPNREVTPMMRRIREHLHPQPLFAALALAIGGCGTNLQIVEVDEVGAGAPPGIVVNKVAHYRMERISVESDVGLDVTLHDTVFEAVDHFRLLSLNVKRQPFADGKLSITLNPAQQLKTVAITSESGAARALGAAASAAEAAAAVRARDDDASE